MLTLRPLQPSDLNNLYTIYSNKKVTRPAGFLPYYYIAALHQQMEEFLQTHTVILLDDKFVGVITSDDLGQQTISLGIMINEQYWHQGIGKEAILQYLNLCKQRNIQTVYADCILKNIASQKLLESCGFEYLQDFKRKFPDFVDEKTCKLYKKSI